MAKLVLLASLTAISCSDIHEDESKCLYEVFKDGAMVDILCLDDISPQGTFCANYNINGMNFNWSGAMCGND